jgi:integrase
MDRPARLTTHFVKGIDRPGRYGDGRGGFGLSLLVRPVKDGLGKNWQQRVRVNDKVRSLGLGSYPDVSLSIVRNRAAKNVAKIWERFPRQTGIDRLLAEADLPAVTSSSAGPTFADVAQESIKFRRTSWKPGSKTEQQTRSLLAHYVTPALGNVAIDQVTSAQVVDVLSRIWHEKPETARKVKRNIQAVFNFAFSKGYTAHDPTPRASTGLGNRRQIVQHHPAVPFSKVGEVLKYVRSSESYESKRLALEFLILTAARTSEVRGAGWAEVDFDEATWTIPADRMKSGREHRVPLSTTALDVLRRTRRERRGFPNDLVFPDRSGREMISQDGLRQLLRRKFEATSHGFRSSFRDWAAEKTDFPSDIVEHALAHLEGSATIRAYRRTDYFDKRRGLMQAWADFVTD